MALRTGRGGFRYYRSVRVGARVLSLLIARGPAALATAAADHDRRLRRRALLADLRAQEELPMALEDEGRALTTLAMTYTGHHRVRRQWRRSPGRAKEAFLDAVQNERLRRNLALAVRGDVARLALETMIRRIGGPGAPAVQAELREAVEKLRDELAGPDPTAVERLLAERVALCWLDLHGVEEQYHRDLPRLDAREREAFERRRDRSDRRYVTALKSLELVRRRARTRLIALQWKPSGDFGGLSSIFESPTSGEGATIALEASSHGHPQG